MGLTYVVIKRQLFKFNLIFAVFLLNLFCRCILLHKPIYGVAVLQKRTEAILEYYLRLLRVQVLWLNS